MRAARDGSERRGARRGFSPPAAPVIGVVLDAACPRKGCGGVVGAPESGSGCGVAHGAPAACTAARHSVRFCAVCCRYVATESFVRQDARGHPAGHAPRHCGAQQPQRIALGGRRTGASARRATAPPPQQQPRAHPHTPSLPVVAAEAAAPCSVPLEAARAGSAGSVDVDSCGVGSASMLPLAGLDDVEYLSDLVDEGGDAPAAESPRKRFRACVGSAALVAPRACFGPRAPAAAGVSSLACSSLACSSLACSSLTCNSLACSSLGCSSLACSSLACNSLTCSSLACSSLGCSSLAGATAAGALDDDSLGEHGVDASDDELLMQGVDASDDELLMQLGLVAPVAGDAGDPWDEMLRDCAM